MSRRRGRVGPSDPQDILMRNAQQRAADRIRSKTPGEWGVSAEIVLLPTSREVQVTFDQRGQVLAANRSDPYDLLHARTTIGADKVERRSLSDEQHRAARRLFRDMVLASGAREPQETFGRDLVDGGRGDPGAPTQTMIDASKRANVALGGVGPVNARLLKALNEPMIRGERRPWRAIVQRQTAETDRNAQGAMVRQACESLALVYRDIDERARAKAQERLASLEVRPFSSFAAPAET